MRPLTRTAKRGRVLAMPAYSSLYMRCWSLVQGRKDAELGGLAREDAKDHASLRSAVHSEGHDSVQVSPAQDKLEVH